LLTRIVDDEKVIDEALASAERIAAGAPLVARWHKQWVRRLMQGEPLTVAEKRDAFAFLDTADYREGLDAFFAQTQAAVHRPLSGAGGVKWDGCAVGVVRR